MKKIKSKSAISVLKSPLETKHGLLGINPNSTIDKQSAILAIQFAEQEAEKRAVKALTHALKYMTSLSKEQKIAIAMHFDDALNDGGQDNGNKKEYAIGEDIHITLVCAESTHECNGCLFDSKDGCMAYAIDDDMLCCINRTDGKDVIFKLKE